MPNGKRNLLPLFLTMPPDERQRLAAFTKSMKRPTSWIVRDAVRAYLDAVEGDAAKLNELQAKLAAPVLDLSAGVPVLPRGRPPKGKGPRRHAGKVPA